MSHAISHLVIEHILPHLHDKQIDGLRETNVFLNEMIERRRLNLPRSNMKWIKIEEIEEEEKKKLCFKNTEGTYQEVEMEDSKLAKNLETVKVEDLELNGSSACGLLGEKWLSTIKKVKVTEIDDEKVVQEFAKRLNCSKLILLNNDEEMDGVQLIQKMPYIQDLELDNCNFSLEFFELLAKKTQNGPGLEFLYLKNWNETPFNAEHLAHFIKNGKFNPDGVNRIKIRPSLEDQLDFGMSEALFELSSLEGWEVRNVTASEIEEVYRIETPNAKIELVIDYFLVLA